MSTYINPEQREAVLAIEPTVKTVIADHISAQKGKLWMPSELIPTNHRFQQLPPELGGLLVLNLLTEDGLPYFMGLLVKHLGDEGPFFEWTRLWTAEEDRHGTVIKQYLTGALSRSEMVAIERMQYDYLRLGFWPDWSNDPFRLLAYVVLQEKATQQSHGAVARQARNVDPVLAKIMGKIAGEEYAHHRAYFTMFGALMKEHPTHAISALFHVINSFAMPGHQIPGFKQLAKLQTRLQAFSALKLHQIADDVWSKLDIGSLTDLKEAGERARDDLAAFLQRLKRIGEREANQTARRIDLPIFNETVTV